MEQNKNYNNRYEYGSNQNQQTDVRRMSKNNRNDERYSRWSDEEGAPYSYRNRDNERSSEVNYGSNYDRDNYNNRPTEYRSSYDDMSYGQRADNNNMNRYNYERERTYSGNHSSSEYEPYGSGYEPRYGHQFYSNRTSYAGKGPKGWQRSNENIRERVCDALERDPSVDATEIEVTVKDGTVTLSGKVDHRSSKRRAENLIEDLPGVKDVRNEIFVDQSFFQQAKEMFTGEDSSSPSDKSSSRLTKSTR